MNNNIYISVHLPRSKMAALKDLYTWALTKYNAIPGKRNQYINLLGCHMEDMNNRLEHILKRDLKQAHLHIQKGEAAAFAMTWGKITNVPGMEGGIIVTEEIIAAIHKKSITEQQNKK